jgi:hypothetical protein
VRLDDARGLTVARPAPTGGGRQNNHRRRHAAGAAVLDRVYDAGGAMNDGYDVKIAMTNASLFAYVADGRHGCVVQLTRPRRRRRISASTRGQRA